MYGISTICIIFEWPFWYDILMSAFFFRYAIRFRNVHKGASVLTCTRRLLGFPVRFQ